MPDTPGLNHSAVEALVRRAVEAELERRNRKLLSLAAVGLAVVGLGTAWRSFAQASCAQTLPSPLVTFCPDAPAYAADVNGNFGALATTLQNRTGPLTVAGNGITTSGVTVAATGRRGSFDGTELVLDNAARRGSAPDGGTRRALVHDLPYTLTINYGGDYTNGVAVSSAFAVYGSQTVTGTITQGCPSTYPIGGGAVTMVDMGVYCITQAAPAGMARNAVSWIEANEFCVSRGLRMCNLAEVSAAARLPSAQIARLAKRNPAGPSGPSCGANTASFTRMAAAGGKTKASNTRKPTKPAWTPASASPMPRTVVARTIAGNRRPRSQVEVASAEE